MLIKYGKPMQMRAMGRNLDGIRDMIETDRQNSERCYKAPVEEIEPRCRICGGGQGVALFVSVWGKYKYYQCVKCGAIFLHNLPDIKELYTADSTANSGTYIDDTFYERRIEMISAPKVQFVLDVCEQVEYKVFQWLDIGCGGGEILSYLKNTEIKAIGIESDANEVAFALGKGLEVHQHYIDIEKNNSHIDELIQTSDIISCINVIEHIENPVSFVNYLCERMKAGSVLVFEVPRHPSISSFANQTCPNAVYRHIASPGHLQVFSDKSIEYMLNDKYEIIGKWLFGQGWTDLINNAMLLSGLEESQLYVDLINLTNRIQPIIDEAGFADTMLVVAKKL